MFRHMIVSAVYKSDFNPGLRYPNLDPHTQLVLEYNEGCVTQSQCNIYLQLTTHTIQVTVTPPAGTWKTRSLIIQIMKMSTGCRYESKRKSLVGTVISLDLLTCLFNILIVISGSHRVDCSGEWSSSTLLIYLWTHKLKSAWAIFFLFSCDLVWFWFHGYLL